MNRAAFLHAKNRRRRSGMVLFEVVVALTVFTLVAFALVLALNGSFEAAQARDNVETAIRGLDNRLALIHGGHVIPGTTELPDDGTGIDYRLEVVQLQVTDRKKQPVPNLYRATITASWKIEGEKDPEQRDISVLLYEP